MKFLRSIAADLVDKRLVPVVVVLVALAIAIPVGASVFAGGSSKPAAVSPGKAIALPAGTPSPAKALEDVAGPNTPTAKHYTKPELNPFRNSAAITTTAAKTATPATTTKATTVAVANTKTATTKPAVKKTTPAVKTTPKPVTSTPSTVGAPVAQLAKLRSVQSYAVNVKVQDATGTRSLRDLVRLSPLPSATNALAEYLGVAKSGRAADFVLNRGVVASGPGVCLPSTSNCQVLELKPGQVEALGQSGASGQAVYQGVVAVTNWGVVTHSSSSAAATARRQEDQTGRQLMLAAPQPTLEKLVYTVAQGVVSLLGNLGNTVAGILNNGN